MGADGSTTEEDGMSCWRWTTFFISIPWTCTPLRLFQRLALLDEDSKDTLDETLRMVPGVGMTDEDAKREVGTEAVKGGPTWP